jgi:hypothetical protein
MFGDLNSAPKTHFFNQKCDILIIIKSGSKFKVLEDPNFDSELGKWKLKLIQIQ